MLLGSHVEMVIYEAITMCKWGTRATCVHLCLSPLFPFSPPLRAAGWRLKVEESKPINLFSQLVMVNENIWISCDTRPSLFTNWGPAGPHIKSPPLFIQCCLHHFSCLSSSWRHYLMFHFALFTLIKVVKSIMCDFLSLSLPSPIYSPRRGRNGSDRGVGG